MEWFNWVEQVLRNYAQFNWTKPEKRILVFHAVLLLCRICLFPIVGTYFWMDIVAALSDGNVDS